MIGDSVGESREEGNEVVKVVNQLIGKVFVKVLWIALEEVVEDAALDHICVADAHFVLMASEQGKQIRESGLMVDGSDVVQYTFDDVMVGPFGGRVVGEMHYDNSIELVHSLVLYES